MNKQFIAGHWANGQESAIIKNLNPYTDALIYALPSAGQADVDSFKKKPIIGSALTSW